MINLITKTSCEYFLLKLGTDEKVSLATDQSTFILENFKVTRLENQPSTSNEVFILETASQHAVIIDGRKVFALAHIEAHQPFTIDDQHYVILQSGRPFLNALTPRIVESPLDETLLAKDRSDFPQVPLRATLKIITLFQILAIFSLHFDFLKDTSVAQVIPKDTVNLSQKQTSKMLQDLDQKLTPPKVVIVEAIPPPVHKVKVEKPKSHDVTDQNRALLESYLLEARFDPEAARQKIHHLAAGQKNAAEKASVLSWLNRF